MATGKSAAAEPSSLTLTRGWDDYGGRPSPGAEDLPDCRRDSAGVPCLARQLVLLFKARANRPKDQHDFLGVLPLLAPRERSWLATAMQRVHPGHQWLDLLQ